MFLLLDIGNSRIKGALVSSSGQFSFFEGEEKTLEILTNQSIIIAIYFATGQNLLVEQALNKSGRLIKFDHTCPIPIKNGYRTPETLGPDRLASVCAAHAFHPSNPSLVIDLGTAITYDVIDSEGTYKGGAISPGLIMRTRALSDYTSRLPLIKIEQNPTYTGTDTYSSIASGVYFGVVAEINDRIAAYEKVYPRLKVILCGGNSDQFESKLKGTIFVRPNLVLEGLYEVLKYNATIL